MRTVYVCEPNCVLHKSGEAIFIKKGGRKIDHIPLVDVGSIVIFGNTQVSTPALGEFFERGIDVVFMSVSGFTRGRILAERASNVVLRIAQFERWRQPEFALDLSRLLIGGKIRNQCALMKKYFKYTGNEKIKACVVMLESAIKKLTEVKDTNALMGVEGAAARAYFE